MAACLHMPSMRKCGRHETGASDTARSLAVCIGAPRHATPRGGALQRPTAVFKPHALPNALTFSRVRLTRLQC